MAEDGLPQQVDFVAHQVDENRWEVRLGGVPVGEITRNGSNDRVLVPRVLHRDVTGDERKDREQHGPWSFTCDPFVSTDLHDPMWEIGTRYLEDRMTVSVEPGVAALDLGELRHGPIVCPGCGRDLQTWAEGLDHIRDGCG